MTGRLARALPFTVGLWAVGVQVNEALAAAGLIATALLATALAASERRLNFDGDARRYLPLFLFFAWAVVAPSLAGRFPTITGVLRLANLLAIPVAAFAASRLTPRARRAVAIAAGATLTLSCVVAGFQHYGVWPKGDELTFLSVLHVPFLRVYETIPNAPGRYMAGGLLFHRLKFANVSGLVILALATAALHARGRLRIVTAAIVVLGFVSVFTFPLARAAAVSLLAALILWAALSFSGSRRSLLVAAIASVTLVIMAGAAFAFSPGLRTRFFAASTQEGSGDRAEIHAAGVRAFEAHPLLGVGLGRFRIADWAAKDAPTYVLENPGKTHLELLTIAAESGAPAALLYVLALLVIGRALFARRRLYAAGLASLVFYALLSALHDPLYHAEFGMALPLALGLWLGLPAAADVPAEVHPGK